MYQSIYARISFPLLPLSATDGYCVMQLLRYENVFYSEQRAAREDCAHLSFSRQKTGQTIFALSHLTEVSNAHTPECICVYGHMFACSQSAVFYWCVFRTGTHTQHGFCGYRCPLSVIEDDEEAAGVWGYCLWNIYESKLQSSVIDCGMQLSLIEMGEDWAAFS